MHALIGGVTTLRVRGRILDLTLLDLVPLSPLGSDRFADPVLWGTGDGIVGA